MLAQKETAAHSGKRAAYKNKSRSALYRNCVQQSSRKLKEQVGTLLLALQTPLNQRHRKKCWHIFESKLRRFIDLKICGGMV